jgi:hypothetical protein
MQEGLRHKNSGGQRKIHRFYFAPGLPPNSIKENPSFPGADYFIRRRNGG